MFKPFLGLFLFCFVLLQPAILQAQEVTPEAENLEATGYWVERVMERPMITSIVWAPDGRMFWTEKDGIVGTMSPEGEIQEEPVVQVSVLTENEQGLLSVALDPAFEENHYFYIFYSAPPSGSNPSPANLIFRYTEENGVGVNPVQLMRIEIPQNGLYLHNGGRLRFGIKDNFLYVSIGDMGDRGAGQDFNNIGGKIHRFVVSGNQLLAAPGNPYPGNSIWALGLRNTFAFDFDPITGNIFATENGPECDDEINLIIPGQNYGWTADVDCNDPIGIRQSAGLPPLVSWTPTISPTGIMVYDGDAFPAWKGQLFYCSFKMDQLRRVQLNEFRTAFANGEGELVDTPNDQHCEIELAQGPGGLIYYSDPDEMLRIVPKDAGF